MKRIGVIGSVNRDTIVGADGATTRSLGGILYTALALAYLARGGCETWLLCKVGADVVAEVRPLLAAAPGLRQEGVAVVEAAGFHSHIHYRADGSKSERLCGDLAPMGLAELEPFLADLDGLIVNFITGFELELETMVALRRRLGGFVLMDVHSLTLGRRGGGGRFWRRPLRWQTWIAQADVVQMNEAEAALLGGGEECAGEGMLATFAREILDLGPRGVALTRGALGALGAHRVGGVVQQWRQPAESPGRAVDSTGCGDVFLAGLGWGLAAGRPLPEAMVWAGRAAAGNSTLRGVEGLGRLAALNLS